MFGFTSEEDFYRLTENEDSKARKSAWSVYFEGQNEEFAANKHGTGLAELKKVMLRVEMRLTREHLARVCAKLKSLGEACD